MFNKLTAQLLNLKKECKRQFCKDTRIWCYHLLISSAVYLTLFLFHIRFVRGRTIVILLIFWWRLSLLLWEYETALLCLRIVYNKDNDIVNWTEVMKSMKDDCIKRRTFSWWSDNSYESKHRWKSSSHSDFNRINQYWVHWNYSCCWVMNFATTWSFIHTTAFNFKNADSHWNIQLFT